MLRSTTPLLSVVIPTHKRPQFLPRAIDSALLAAPDGDVEVIVVPNGPDASWKSVAERFKRDERVQWHPIETAHANAARNHGMALAVGRYIRFLDDDDYLLASSALQCVDLERSRADVSLGEIDLVNSAGVAFRAWAPIRNNDFVVAMLSPGRVTHNCSLVFRRSSIAGQSWDESRHIGQDTAFALSLARDRELSCHHSYEKAGVWVHHSHERISSKGGVMTHNQITAEIIINSARGLAARDALGDSRKRAAALGIWACVHNAFPLAPLYWSKIASEATELDPSSRPPGLNFSKFHLKAVPPVWLEWILAPPKLIKIHLRERARAAGKIPPW